LTNKIAEKNTTFSTTSKFMSNMHVDSIYKTPKNSKMMA
jgi:chromosome segregation and condensation protein ScpB